MAISVIICSRQATMPASLRDHIDQTIGVEHEVIWIDNSANRYTIFEAYSEGLKRAQYAYLCFMHEDIVFRSHDWGRLAIAALERQQTGAVGVIGGCYAGKMSLSWYSDPACCRGHVIQGMRQKGRYTTREERFGEAGKVCAVDGLWICIRKELFDTRQIAWDEQTYGGFHLYDFDICMQLNHAGYEVVVIDGVDIEHRSLGTKNGTFYEEVMKFHTKWDECLPLLAHDFRLPDSFDEQKLMLREYCQLAQENFRRIENLSHWSHRLVNKFMK